MQWTLSSELSSLKVVVKDLKANVTTALPVVNVPNPTDFPSLAHLPTVSPSSLGNRVSVDHLANKSHVHSTKHDQHHHSSDRKYNIVLFGIDECSVGTSRHERLESDFNNVTEVVSGIDESIKKHSIKDCFRLGKFNRASRRPRPILVKFVRTADVSSILYKKVSLSHPFSIKPDLSPEERLREAALLKERWNLIGPQARKNQKQFNFGFWEGARKTCKFNLSDHCLPPANKLVGLTFSQQLPPPPAADPQDTSNSHSD